MKKVTSKLSLILLVIFPLLFAGCPEDQTGPDNTDPGYPDPPSKIRATSINETTVRIAWDAAPRETESVFKDYILDINPGGFQSITIAKNLHQYDVTGLTHGVVYTFTLHSRFTNDKECKNPITIMWSPADRYGEVILEEIKVYETESTFGSGLDLNDPTSDKPVTRTIQSSAMWDLGLDTKTTGEINFGPARGLSYNYTNIPTNTEVSDSYWFANSLDDVLDSISIDNKTPWGGDYYNLMDYNPGNRGGIVLLVRVQNLSGKWNYAKVFVKYMNGNWLQGSGKDKYLECIVSYQKTEDVPYAKKPGS